MEITFLKNLRRKAKYWWVGLLIGVLILCLGIWSLSVPVTTLFSLNILFIAGFIASGLGDIFYAFSVRKDRHDWGWILASGIISLMLGLVLVSRPLESIIVLLLYVGFWATFQSVMMISSSIMMQRFGFKGWGWILTFGIIGILFSFVLITNPAFASSFIITLFAFSLVLYGIARIFYAFKLRGIYKIIKSEKLDI
ncbi:hypothetical protein Bcop_1256 [Bacteroides coprosuis DSM 18011]|uniref:HdeD family acid-resistance protein n=1 Tax=Bacteroides coprosuis DSM 18011 TaxID=679937 RepID=F3ZNB9_9BACE|nr:DUF308 domain-containing protein [Bacteroides coprosuis]EGJ71459.1 hypothetical protein Bcop_1256 [Bacteroides coprosuis DSM 18011]HJD93049.1 DUF308 domain-containing protein [Bacteroides coprosuis]